MPDDLPEASGAVAGLLSEDHLAARVQFEMSQRGWSQDRLAREMAQVGHPLHQSAISKIINPGGGKRRNISVDEAIGFARVFGTPLESLLVPVEAARAARLSELVQQVDEAAARVVSAFDDLEARRGAAEPQIAEALAEIGSDDDSTHWLDDQLRRVGARLYMVYVKAQAQDMGAPWEEYRRLEEAFLEELGAYTEVARRGQLDRLEEGSLEEWADRDYIRPRLQSGRLGKYFRAIVEAEDQARAQQLSDSLNRLITARMAVLAQDRRIYAAADRLIDP